MAPKARPGEKTSAADVEAVMAQLRSKGILQDTAVAKNEAAEPAPAKKPKPAKKIQPAKASAADATTTASEGPDAAPERVWDMDLKIYIEWESFAEVWKKVREHKGFVTKEQLHDAMVAELGPAPPHFDLNAIEDAPPAAEKEETKKGTPARRISMKRPAAAPAADKKVKKAKAPDAKQVPQEAIIEDEELEEPSTPTATAPAPSRTPMPPSQEKARSFLSHKVQAVLRCNLAVVLRQHSMQVARSLQTALAAASPSSLERLERLGRLS